MCRKGESNPREIASPSSLSLAASTWSLTAYARSLERSTSMSVETA